MAVSPEVASYLSGQDDDEDPTPSPDVQRYLARAGITTKKKSGEPPTGLSIPGNVDLTNRPRVKNPDGSISTVRSMSFNEDGKEILVPTVSDDGRILSDDEAIDQYHKTGKHLGIFDSPEHATAYAQQLHADQAAQLDKSPGEPLTGPSRPKPQHGGVGETPPVGQPHGTSRDFGQTPLLERLWRGINEGDTAPDEHLTQARQPPEATFESTADFAKEARAKSPLLPKAPAAQADVAKVTPQGSVQQQQEALNAPQASRTAAARSMRETATAAGDKAQELRAAGQVDAAADLERKAVNANKTADELEQTAGPLATIASVLGQTLPFIHDPYEHENRIIREASMPGAVPSPKEQVALGVKHPGTPRAAPALTSPEGAAELVGQIPGFELYGAAGEAAGGLLGTMAGALGKAVPEIAPVTDAVTSGVAKLKAAAELPEPAGPRVPMTKLPKAAFTDEANQLLAQLKPRLARSLTQGAEGVFGTSYASARSQGASREDALKAALESVPANIPFAVGMEALGAVSGPLTRIGEAGANIAGRAAMETGATGATPLVDAMRRVKEAHQLPNIPGAKTPFDGPDVVATRAESMSVPSTHLNESPERQLWRTEAQKEHFENAKLYAPNGAPAAGRQAWLVIGGPGVGKSSIIKDIAAKGQAMVTDADDAKKLTPEWQANRNMAWSVHQETAKINAKVIKQAVKEGLNFVWPTVGGNANDLGQRVHELKGAGYDVHLAYVHAPAAVAAKRVVDRWRAGKQGFIDPANVLAYRGVSQATFGKLVKSGDIAGYEAYDNSVNGRPPQLIRSSDTDRAAQAAPAGTPAGTGGAPAGAPGGDGRAGVRAGLLGQLGEAAQAGEVARGPAEPGDDTLVGRLRQMVAEDRARQPTTPVSDAHFDTSSQPITPMGNVELTSENAPGLTAKELDQRSPRMRRAGLTLFINKVVRPIVRSEGLPDHVTKGLGSWFSQGSLAMHEGGTVRFPREVTLDQVHRVLARVSEAAKQNGYFAAIPDAHGDRLAIELDFGKALSPKELSDAVEHLSRADGGRRFNGSTMRDLSPARVQIVLNEGATKADAAAVLDLAHQTLAEPGDTGPASRFRGLAYSATVADGFDPAKFSQVVADRGGLSGSQVRADKSARFWYKTLATASRTIGKAGELVQDFHHATAPHQSLALDALGKYGVFLPPLAAAALPGSDEDKAKRFGAASAVFLAPRFRREILEGLEKNPTYGYASADSRAPAETWVQRLTAGVGYEGRQNLRTLLGTTGEWLSAYDVKAKIESAKAPDRQVPLVSRLRKWLTQTPADSPRALGKKWDQPTPVADWIGKITSGAAQAGVKKDEIQLLVSALKGEPAGNPIKSPAAAIAEMGKSEGYLNARERSASDWAFWVANAMRGGPGEDSLHELVMDKLLQGHGQDPNPVLSFADVHRALEPFTAAPAAETGPALPDKLTRADVLQLLDEKLPQVERVVLHAGEKEPAIDEDLPGGEAAGAATMPVVEHTLTHLSPEVREDFIRQQIAHRKAAQVDLNDNLRRLSPEVDDDDYNADPAAVIEAHGWDPTAMEAHIQARTKRIKAVEGEIESKIEDAESERDRLSEVDDDERRRLHEEIGHRAKDEVYRIFGDGWDGDGFSRDAIDDAVQRAQEDVETPDYDPEELLKDNGYSVEPVEPEWVFSPHKHQGVLFGDHNDDSAQEGSGDIIYTPREIQEFLAEEHNGKLGEGIAHGGLVEGGRDSHRTPHRDPEDFDADNITREDAFRLFRRDHGGLTAKLVKHDPEEFVIVNPKGEIQKVSWGQDPREYRGDDRSDLINEFISDRSLDAGLNDERMDEVARAVRRAANAFSKWKEADQMADDFNNDGDNDNFYFRDEREEIEEHEWAIAEFEEARDNPSEPPVDAGERAEKVGELTKRLHDTITEIGQLKKLGVEAREDRKRLGTGKHVPEAQGEPRYRGTQVSPGPSEDYRELIPIWANAPIKDRTPPTTHFGEHYPEDIGHARASTHLHYEIPGLNEEGAYKGLFTLQTSDPLFQAKSNYNSWVVDRRERQEKMAQVEAQLAPLDRIGAENLTPGQQAEARRLAGEWRTANNDLASAMDREARQIEHLADVMHLTPQRIGILEENQNDPAQTAAGRGVKTEGSLRAGVPPNPFMRGGTVEKKGTSRSGDEESRYDVDGELGYRLNAVNFLADAVERGETMIGWQDASTASAVHNFRRKAAKHVYEEVTPSAIRDALRFAGVPEKDIPKPVHMLIAGAGHWVMRLTPEIKAAVKKMGLPIMGLALMAGLPKTAKAQGDENTEEPASSNLSAWLATGVGAAVALAALAWAKKRKGGVEQYPEEIQDLLDQADSILAKRRAMTRGRDVPDPKGQGYRAAFDTAETPDQKGPAFYNVGKLGLSAEGEKLWRGVVGDPGLKRRISQETGVDAARVRALDPDALLIKDKWDAIDSIAGRMFISETTERLVDLQKDLEEGKLTAKERTQKTLDYARLVGDLAEVSEKATTERQEAGRTLNFYKIATKAIGFDPQSWSMLARRAKGEPLTSQEITRVIHLLKSQDRLELASYVNGLRPSTLAQRIAEGIRLGMLSSWTTLEKITASHLISELRRVAQHPLAVGLDYLMAAGGAALHGGTVTEHRTMALAVKGQMGARAEGARRGLRQAAQTLKSGTTEEDIGRLDAGRVNFRSPFMRGAQRLIYGMHALGYAPFREAEFEAVYRELALVEAKKLHVITPAESVASIHDRLMATTPPELVSRAMEEARRISYTHKSSTLRKIPMSGEMLEQAAQEADMAVFQDQDSLLGAIARGARRGAESSGIGSIASAFVFPFSTIPANIATRLVDSTPVGILSAAIRQMGRPFDQRRLAQDLAYALSGSTGMLWLGYVLYHKGLLSGLPPTDQKENRLAMDEGKQPLSLKLGDTWYSLADIGPEGMSLALGAAWYQALEEEPSIAKALGRETGAIGAVIASAPFLSGIKEATDAMSDPIRHGESFIKSMAQAVVPASVRRVARASDPTIRETNGPMGQIQSAIPGLSKQLPERLTRFGEPQTRTTGERVAEVLSPVRIRHQSTDPVYQELDRLKVGLPTTRTKVYEAGKSRPTTPEERHAESETTGPILKRAYQGAITSPEYTDLPDETKRALLEKVGNLPADAVRWVGNHRADNTAPTDQVERKVQSDLKKLVAEAVNEAGTGTRRLERIPRPSASIVAPGTQVSPGVAAYLRQQRLDARHPVRTP